MQKVTLVLFITVASTPAFADPFLYSPLQEVTVVCDFCGYSNLDGSCHGGIDMRARTSFTVFVAEGGRIVRVVDGHENTYHVPRSQQRRIYGNLVEVLHPNGYRTIYAHLQAGSLLVRARDEVERGQVIGLTDNSGWSTAPHLHFEVRDPSGRRVDPYGTGRDNTRCLTTINPACGANPLWVTCPPRPWDPRLADRDNDGYCGSAAGCAGTLRPGDCDDTNAAINPGAAEVCDSVDNNCALGIDENWRSIGAASLGNACNVGLGACLRTGTMVCTADHRATVCSIDPGVPTAEVCDNLNNDCDCEGSDCRCGSPTRSCVCVGPRCTELIDEDFRAIGAASLGNTCTVGIGICVNTGIMVCTADHRATVCNADPGISTAEICNGLDDDCDGVVDEITQTCGTAPPGGVCRWGARTCRAGTWGECLGFVPLGPEVCDGIDNDCDGATDEGVDQDGDGHLALCSGGDDCNDSNTNIYPGRSESLGVIEEALDGVLPETPYYTYGLLGKIAVDSANRVYVFYRSVEGRYLLKVRESRIAAAWSTLYNSDEACGNLLVDSTDVAHLFCGRGRHIFCTTTSCSEEVVDPIGYYWRSVSLSVAERDGILYLCYLANPSSGDYQFVQRCVQKREGRWETLWEQFAVPRSEPTYYDDPTYLALAVTPDRVVHIIARDYSGGPGSYVNFRYWNNESGAFVDREALRLTFSESPIGCTWTDSDYYRYPCVELYFHGDRTNDLQLYYLYNGDRSRRHYWLGNINRRGGVWGASIGNWSNTYRPDLALAFDAEDRPYFLRSLTMAGAASCEELLSIWVNGVNVRGRDAVSSALFGGTLAIDQLGRYRHIVTLRYRRAWPDCTIADRLYLGQILEDGVDSNCNGRDAD